MSTLDTGIVWWNIGVEGPQPEKLRLTGKDNHGNLRQEFADRLAAYSCKELQRATEDYIWLSAWAANNYKSDYHWKCDACYDECIRRDAAYLYDSAWHRASGM